MAHSRRPLTSRPLDLLYFVFFLTHIPATLLIDLQVLFPKANVPEPLAHLLEVYLQTTADPILAGAVGLNSAPESWVWIKSFLVLEAVFQLPVFLIGLRALWKDSRTLYPLLLIYSASSATTTLPCLSTILTTPLSSTALPASLLSPFSSSTLGSAFTGTVSITREQRTLLLAAYVPYLIVPLMMCVDMAVRVAGLVAAGLRAMERKEVKVE